MSDAKNKSNTINQKNTASVDEAGWLSCAQRVPSPNFDDRPDVVVDTLVIHNISLPPGEFGGNYIQDFFCNQLDCRAHPFFQEIATLKVSAHFLIKRDGEIVQFVPLSKRAWHAGVSEFKGRQKCNDFSIGIELEGVDDTPYSDAQYESLIKLTADIQRMYPAIVVDRITGHSDIAPDRKTDPGPAFDWRKFLGALS